MLFFVSETPVASARFPCAGSVKLNLRSMQPLLLEQARVAWCRHPPKESTHAALVNGCEALDSARLNQADNKLNAAHD